MGLLVRQLVDSNPGVVAILQRIISSESKNVTVPSKVRASFRLLRHHVDETA
jgi:hypothetical protein